MAAEAPDACAVGSGLGVYVLDGGAVPGGRTLTVFSGAWSLGVGWVPGWCCFAFSCVFF